MVSEKLECTERRIVIDPQYLTISVEFGRAQDENEIPLVAEHARESPPLKGVASEALYALLQDADEDFQVENPGMMACMTPPEPWQIAIGVILVYGVRYGLGWQQVRQLLEAAYKSLLDGGVLPARLRGKASGEAQLATRMGKFKLEARVFFKLKWKRDGGASAD